jgi:hypothetical protein
MDKFKIYLKYLIKYGMLKHKVIIMMDIALDVQTLPEPIFSRIHTPKVKVHEENGIITLIPIKMEKANIDKFIGMFSDGKLSSEKFIQGE